ncbi:GxxExxY protein [Sedimentisphaera salicampi]|uniref:GxxExxY protein n=1 Tax=Sedimentisphaera salicampi TaxID=1941349 RepID=A0A1W6LPJ0_9BACT|nr:GxxExxY protein [Sedimentisphaera salicampi]ARN57699.1 GxxExxY protein [Sedimentisphaera salicampi]
MSVLKHGELSEKVIRCAMNVHSVLGPGLLESAYNQCLCHELHINGISFEREKPLPVVYKDCRLDCGYRIDIMVEDKIIVELKSISELKEIHKAQLLSYMKLAGINKGLLLNFNVTHLRNGLESLVL